MHIVADTEMRINHYTMTVHSSKRILVEEISTFRNRQYDSLLADAIIQLAISKGRREEVRNINRGGKNSKEGSKGH